MTGTRGGLCYLQDCLNPINTVHLLPEDALEHAAAIAAEIGLVACTAEVCRHPGAPLTHLLHRLTDFSWCSESVFV